MTREELIKELRIIVADENARIDSVVYCEKGRDCTIWGEYLDEKENPTESYFELTCFHSNPELAIDMSKELGVTYEIDEI